MRFELPRAFPLYAGRTASLCSLGKMETQAIPAATLMFNFASFLAAFGFVAFVLVFVHPASQVSRAGVQRWPQPLKFPLQGSPPRNCSRALRHRKDCVTQLEIRQREKHEQGMQP